MRDALRAVGGGSELAVLMEGPTACGKTSVVRYLAERLGFQFVRVNNHQHLELEEYVGSYKWN